MYQQLKEHPVTGSNPLPCLYRYIRFNTSGKRMTKSVYQWIEPLRFYAKQGDAVMVSNIYFGLFEFDESILLLHLLKEGDLFLDIVANSGHYSLVVSGLRKVRSIAIEPVPGIFQRLRDNIELNQLSAFYRH
jgi:hypothetical protein